MKVSHSFLGRAVVAAAVMLAAAASSLATVLNVPQYNQEQDQWCWNASAQMVLAFYGHSYSQTTIASWAVGGQNIPNYLYGSTDSSMHGDDEILQHFGSIASTGHGSALSLSETTTEIGSSKPIMIRWGWYNGGGHIAVIHGVSGNTVYVRDPWPDNGSQVQSYEWVCHPYGNTGSWTHSLTMNSGHSDNQYYEYYVYYYNLASQWYSYGNYANAYYYYANAMYYYYMYSNGDSNLAKSYYYYYYGYAYYYYYSSLGYSNTAYACYCYGNAYSYYYYAYYVYNYYMAQGNSSYASYYYNYYMGYASYYYNLYLYYI